MQSRRFAAFGSKTASRDTVTWARNAGVWNVTMPCFPVCDTICCNNGHLCSSALTPAYTVQEPEEQLWSGDGPGSSAIQLDEHIDEREGS